MENYFKLTNKKNIYLLCVLMLLPISAIAQNSNTSAFEIISLVDKLDSIPVSISFMNSLVVNNNGGHLQGIQYYQYNQNDYYFMSGSSDSYSYYSVVKMGEENSVISINKILDKPFKHAGGFQISNNLMAIGVEDNSERDKSKVFIYRIDNPENLPKEPLEIVDRFGTIERATAGCVGIIEIRDNILMVVGDWNTEHLDFYKIKKEKIGLDGDAFELVYSINIESLDKSDWVDDIWLSYQNINFIRDELDNLYLAGMASNKNEENILDLFKIETEEYLEFEIRKIYTKCFVKNIDSNFNCGAGVHLSNESLLKIISCGANITKESKITIYK